MRWTVRQKLILPFLFIAILVFGIGVFGVYSLNQLSANTEEILQENQPTLTNMAAVESKVLFHSLKVDQYIATGNRARLRGVEELRSDMERRLAELEEQVQGTEDETLVQEIRMAYDSYVSLSDDLQDYYQQNPDDTAAIEGRQTRIAALLENSLLAKADSLYAVTEQKAQDLVQANSELNQIYIRITIVASIILFGLVIVLSFLVSRSIVMPIDQLAQTAERVAEGDLAVRAEVRTGDEIGTLADRFNSMTTRFQELVENLEQRVAERTRELARRSTQLEAASQVARGTAAIRDVNELLDETVDLISDRFGFYHAGVFLVDDKEQFAVLRAASSEGGKRMLAHGHQLRVGQIGVVGYVAEKGEPRIALDVGADVYYFDNPDLPHTRSEIALPLRLRGRVIGVLDVQSIDEAAFSEEDAAVLQTMADQIALAIENARLLAQSLRALEELETSYGQRLQDAWRQRGPGPVSAFRYTRVGVESASRLPEFEMPSDQRSSVVADPETGHQMTVPIRLRDQVLGSLVLRRESEQSTWSQQDITMVEELSNQIALALESARLYQDTQRRAARDRMLGEVTTRIRETLDMDTMLQIAIREIGDALGLAEVEVRMGRTRSQESEQGNGRQGPPSSSKEVQS